MTTREATCRNCANDFTFTAKGGIARPLCESCETSHKWCPSCGYALARPGFGPDSRTRDGLEGCCKQCKGRQASSRRIRGYRVDPRRDRLSKIKARYGINEADWDRMVVEQGGRCAICEVATGALVVDHCHDSGRVRGLLCAPCNKGLGHFADDADKMVAAVAYLLTKRQEG